MRRHNLVILFSHKSKCESNHSTGCKWCCKALEWNHPEPFSIIDFQSSKIDLRRNCSRKHRINPGNLTMTTRKNNEILSECLYLMVSRGIILQKLILYYRNECLRNQHSEKLQLHKSNALFSSSFWIFENMLPHRYTTNIFNFFYYIFDPRRTIEGYSR